MIGVDQFTDITRPDHDGRVTIRHNGKELSIRFDWAAVKAMQTEWGDDFFAVASRGMDENQIEQLVQVASYGSSLTADEVLDIGLPILAVSKACRAAWQFAWFGGKLPDEVDDAAKKTKPRKTLLGRLLKFRFGRASRGATSGTSSPTQPA